MAEKGIFRLEAWIPNEREISSPALGHRHRSIAGTAAKTCAIAGAASAREICSRQWSPWAVINLVRDYRNGKLTLFAPPRKPGPAPGSAPAKERVWGRVIELRRDGLSTYEISARLATEHTPLNRTSVGEILAEEGFGRLLRHPEPVASTNPATVGRDTRLPRTARLDFQSWPATVETGKAGLLLAVPDLVSLGLPELVKRARYRAPGSCPRCPGCCRCWR